MYGKITFYPSLFRLAIGIILLIDIGSNLFFTESLYNIPGYYHSIDGSLPWLTFIRDNVEYFLSAYIMVIICWILGLGKNVGSFCLYIFYAVDFLLLFPGVFWGDFILRISLFFFIFVNSFQFFSINKDTSRPGIVHRLAVLSIMFNLCIIYIDNAIFKFNNPEWTSGYAMSYFFQFSSPFDIFNIGDVMLSNKYLIRLSSWFILLYQITFPVALWFKRIKFWWIIMGILIHVIMAVTLQLYKFEIIMILLYGFFITDAEWQKILDKLKINIDIIHGKG